jgi:cytochrome c biogenesis protein CcdA/thiol-disulfide isomerase/thioredoxin
VALLLGIAVLAGMVTAVSPCVLPVLPIVFAGGVTGSERRPFAIVGGLVVSFTVFTLTATALLGALGLPDDLLRSIAIGVVLVLGVSLVWPRLGDLLGRPFARLGRARWGDVGGGFLLGASLGLLFTPCAGPVIAAVATLAASRHWSVEAFALTLAYAAGAGIVLLALALAVRRGLSLGALRSRAPAIRRGLGAVVVGAAVLMILGLDTRLASNVPGYTKALQGLEESAAAGSRIERLVGAGPEPGGGVVEGELRDFGEAPDFVGIERWLNSEPLSLAGLRGKVVVIDFWTYSCVNCLRTLPFLRRWYETYRDDGLVIVGVHTPEFAFERDADNVRDAVSDLGIDYPVALDSGYETWNRWGNRYWPAKYFVDRAGHVRWAHFGEGEYETSEQVIRALLAEPGLPPPVSSTIRDRTPTRPQTPETYLGYERLTSYVGSPIRPHRRAAYELPDVVPLNGIAYGGELTIDEERIVAGREARVRLVYVGPSVHLVLGTSTGPKEVQVVLDGAHVGTVTVTEDRLYTLAETPDDGGAAHDLLLELDPGTEAYAFTFG